MRTRTQALIWTGVSVASLSLHVAAFGGLGNPRADGIGGKPKRPPTLVEMTVAKAPEPTPEPPKPAAKPTRRLALARPMRSAPVKAEPTPAAPPPPQAETPADFTGTTLTNDGPGPGWSSAVGNGQAMNVTGPVGTPGARVTGRSLEGGTGEGTGPRVVGVGDLSQVPEAPDLAPMLERYYPAEARRQGVSGKAVIRARIMPDGNIRELKVLSESTAGFGAACRQTLQGSHWSPPLDRTGSPVSTYINYACRFEVH